MTAHSHKYSYFSALILAVVIVGLYLLLSRDSADEDFITASGRLEGRVTHLTAKLPATVELIHVDEGDEVKTGDPLADLVDQALQERLKGAQEGLRSLAAQSHASQLALQTAEQELPLKIEQAVAGLQNSESRLLQANSSLQQARRDAQRLKNLVDESMASKQAAETAALNAELTRVEVQSAESARVIAVKTLGLAELGTQRLEAQKATHESLISQANQAQTGLAELQSQVADLTITAPVPGTLLTRSIEIGEQVAPGSPLFSLLDLNRLYVKIYVPEPAIGKIKLQQEGRVYLDAYPGRLFTASVSKIAQQAEFTPKHVETREERVKLVFAIELNLTANPEGIFKPGMPVDVLLRTGNQDTPWPDSVN